MEKQEAPRLFSEQLKTLICDVIAVCRGDKIHYEFLGAGFSTPVGIKNMVDEKSKVIEFEKKEKLVK